MRIAEIIGTITLSRCHQSLDGSTLRLAVPLAESELAEGTTPAAEE